MRDIRIGKHIISVYDSIDELPIVRYNKYTKYMMIESGVGSDFDSVNRHVERIGGFIKNGQTQYAMIELYNLQQGIMLGLNEFNPLHYSFACLVSAIDTIPCDDITDDGLKRTLEKIEHIMPHTMLAQELEVSKKKIDNEMDMYFPNMGDTSSGKEYYTKLRQRTLLVLENIISGKDNGRVARINDITNDMVTFSKPLVFGGNDSAEIRHEKNFESTCLIMGKELNTNPKLLTTLEFYNAIEYLENQAKEQKKRQMKSKRK